MEDYKVGNLGDLISGGKTSNKRKIVQKTIPTKSPNKSITNGKQNGKKQNNMKKIQAAPANANKGAKNAKKRKQEVVQEEDSDDDEEEVEEKSGTEEEAESDANSDEVDAKEEESDDSGEEEDVNEDSDDDAEDESDDDEEEEMKINEDAVASDSEEEDEDENEVKAGKAGNVVDDEAVKPMYADRTIFVGNVKVGTQAKQLIQHFKKYGKIDTVRFRSIAVTNPKVPKKVAIQKGTLHKNRKTCNAYVRFENKESARNAVEKENGVDFHGFHLRVTMSDLGQVKHDDDKTIFVGNVGFKAEDEDFWSAFSPCGEIESVRIVRDKYTNVSLGFAYVNFKSSDSVQLALQLGDVTIKNRVVRISPSNFSKQKNKKNDNKSKPSSENEKSVFVAKLNAGVSDKTFEGAFAKFGTVVKSRLIKDKDTQKPLGYGFITFDTTEAAKSAVGSALTIGGQEVDISMARNTLKQSRNNQMGKQQKSGASLRIRRKQPPPTAGGFNKNVPAWKRPNGGAKPQPGGGQKGGKPFQGSRGTDGRVNKKKFNKGEVMKKKMVKKVAPKSPK